MFIINEDLLLQDTLTMVIDRLGRELTEQEKHAVIRHMDKLVDNMFQSQSQDVDYLVTEIKRKI